MLFYPYFIFSFIENGVLKFVISKPPLSNAVCFGAEV